MSSRSSEGKLSRARIQKKNAFFGPKIFPINKIGIGVM
jgi:hypothetical protein